MLRLSLAVGALWAGLQAFQALDLARPWQMAALALGLTALLLPWWRAGAR